MATKIANKFERVVFLDRDGVINIDCGYLCDIKKLSFIEGSVEAIIELQENGFAVAIITNQSGIARGYFTVVEFENFMDQYFSKMEELGVGKTYLYYCPHHSEGLVKKYSISCDCRKPGSGMVLKALSDLNISPENAYFVGDKITDMEAAMGAGIENLYLVCDQNIKTANYNKIKRCENLAQAVSLIFENS